MVISPGITLLGLMIAICNVNLNFGVPEEHTWSVRGENIVKEMTTSYLIDNIVFDTYLTC